MYSHVIICVGCQMSDTTRHYTAGAAWEQEVASRFPHAITSKQWAAKKEELKITDNFQWKRKADLIIINHEDKSIRFIEIKHTTKIGGNGSVDEKFETGPYKLYYFQTICESIGYTATYEYIVHKNYDHKRFKEVFEWLNSQNIQITFLEN